MPANVESMFYVRTAPWHGLGTMVKEAPTSEEAIRLAGLDWKVVQKDLTTDDGILVPGFKANVRDEEAYLTQYSNIREARTAIGQYIHTYNFERRHSALDYQTPAECYYPAMLLPYVA